MKKFEPGGDLPQLLGVGIADDEEMISANAAPRVSGLRYGALERKYNDENEGDYGSSHNPSTDYTDYTDI